MAKKKKGWRSSKGRRLLYKDVKKKTIPDSMDYKEAFKLRPEFAVGKDLADAERLFEGRLKAARNTVGERDARAAEEYRMMQEDLLLHPRPVLDRNGFPRWQGSAAQLLLVRDVKEKKHESMSRKEFFMSRPEYYNNYNQRYINRKVDQAAKTRKFLKQYHGKKGYDHDEDNESGNES